MKLHKVDTEAWTVREIDGEPWPGKDSEGDTCYDNTHFVSEGAAWDKLKAEVTAGVRYWGRTVEQAKRELAKAEQEAALMAQALAKVCDQLDARSKTPNARVQPPTEGAQRP